MANVMLTTIDNPYNPFTQFDRWYVFDCQMGYDTCAILARISRNSDELSEADQEIAIEEAINEMLSSTCRVNTRRFTRMLLN